MLKRSNLIINMLMIALFISFSACEENGDEITVYGTIKGKIKDFEELSPIYDAYVSTNPISTTVKTDENGEYILENLIPGEYTLTIRRNGYATESGNKTVEKNQVVIVDFLMEKSTEKSYAPVFATDSLFPEENSKDLDLNIEFKWSATDENPDDILTFDLILYEENELEGEYLAKDITDTIFIVENLQYNTIYRWQVVAKDNNGEKTQSDIFTFRTKERPENPIFFTQKYNGSYEIFASDTSENNKVQLTEGPYINWNPVKSPVNNQVAYVSNADGDFNIYIMEYESKVSKKITVIPIAGYHNPGTGFCWSANGGQLYYPHYDKIYRVNNDGSGLIEFARAPEGKHFRMIDCSLYNKKILALTNEIDGFSNSVIIYNLEGIPQDTILNDLQGTVSSAVFSIDGSKILYCYDDSGLQAEDGRQLDVNIYELDLESGNSTNLSNGKSTGTNDTNARYSATGAEIIFENGYNNSSKKDIYLMGLSGGSSRDLIFENATLPEWR